jgi:beta-lysine 5,6-aminomutase alpha subunit
VRFMETIDQVGLMSAIEQGQFADIKRPRDMGKGLDGLVKKGPEYYNPFETYLKNELGLNA